MNPGPSDSTLRPRARRDRDMDWSPIESPGTLQAVGSPGILNVPDWPPPLPDTLLDWPVPQGQKRRPARWLEDEAGYRAFFAGVLEAQGEDALACIWNDAPRGPGARLTRWFCPGVPMHASGEHVPQRDGRTRHGFLVPARAALLALERGLVMCRTRPLEDA